MPHLFRASRRISVALIACLAILCIALFDDAGTAELSAASTASSAPATSNGLASTPYSNRLIVEFGSPALSEVYTRDQLAPRDAETLVTLGSALEVYAVQLENEHQRFQELVQQHIPEIRPSGLLNAAGQYSPLTFAVVKNAAVFETSADLDQSDRAYVASLPNVKHVYRDFEVFPQLYAGPALTSLESLWSRPQFDRSQSGRGIRIASIDAGLHKSAPMFDGTSFTWPPGYPEGGLGIQQANNGKIVVSRTYFRPDYPPMASDHFAWPGSGSSHGVHTAGIAAGNVVTNASFRGTPLPVLSGVAPGAWLGNYRVFYRSRSNRNTFFTAEGVAALEDTILDGMDIAIGSWGSGPSISVPPHNFLDSALINTVRAGVQVVMAAGNYGPLPFSVANPSPDYLTVGAVSTTGRFAMGYLEAHTPTQPSALLLSDLQFTHASLGPRLASGTSHSFPLVPAPALSPGNAMGCDPWPAHALNGQMLLVQRGLCTFRHKIEQAQDAGASAVLVFNHAAGGQSLVQMASDGKGNIIRIPSLFLGHQAGLMLSQLLATYPDNVSLRVSTKANQVGNQPLVIPDFSGRGPTVFGTLKPDLVAPGAHIISQGYGPTNLGVGRHLAYGQTSGTSMAAPFVAGTIALLREKYPAWGYDRIRSALMNTARYQGIVNHDGSVAQPIDMGAGLLDVEAALETQLLVSPPLVDFGRLQQIAKTGYTREIRLTNVGDSRAAYALSAVRLTRAGPEQLPGITIEPAAVNLEKGSSATVTVSLQPGDAPEPAYLQGHLVIAGEDTEYHAPVFAWLDFPPPHHPLVLIDADLSPLHADYASWYQEALDSLNLDYTYWDTARHGPAIPAWINTEIGPSVILLFAGDRDAVKGQTPMPMVFSDTDLEKLEQYVENGGALWVMGKNIDRVLEGSDLLAYILGTAQIQHRTEDRLGLSRLHLTAAPTAPASWQATDLDVGSHALALGTVNLITGDAIQAWGWDGQYLSGTATYELNNLRQHLHYEIHVQGDRELQLESAQFLIPGADGEPEVVQDLLGVHAPLTAHRAFRWQGILPLQETIHQARLASDLKLRLILHGNPQVTLDTRVPTRDVNSDSAGGALPLHGIQGTAADAGRLVPILGILPNPDAAFWVTGVSRLPPTDSEAGPILFTTFGLEHVNDAQAVTTRAMLLRTALMYLYPDWEIPLPAHPAQ